MRSLLYVCMYIHLQKLRGKPYVRIRLIRMYHSELLHTAAADQLYIIWFGHVVSGSGTRVDPGSTYVNPGSTYVDLEFQIHSVDPGFTYVDHGSHAWIPDIYCVDLEFGLCGSGTAWIWNHSNISFQHLTVSNLQFYLCGTGTVWIPDPLSGSVTAAWIPDPRKFQFHLQHHHLNR